MYTTMRKRRAWPWKVLVRDYIKNIERWWSHFFFQFSLFVFWWSLMEKYLFTLRHWNWLSLSALTRTSVGFFRGNIFFPVGKKIISKKISHRKRKYLFPKQATENNQTEHLHCLILEKWSKRPSCFANLIQSYRAKSGLPGYRIPCMQHLSCAGLLSSRMTEGD